MSLELKLAGGEHGMPPPSSFTSLPIHSGKRTTLEDEFALFPAVASAAENSTVHAFLRNSDLSCDASRLQGVTGTGLGDNCFL